MLRVVKTYEDIADLMAWAENQPFIAVDTETSGTERWHSDFHVRLVQFGNTTEAWVVPLAEWVGPVKAIIQRCRRILMHNASFDIAALAVHGIDVPWEKVDDTMIGIRLAEPHLLAGLKAAATRHISAAAAASQKDLHAAMRKNKWDWGTVPLDFPPYLYYAAMDVILTSRLAQRDLLKNVFRLPIYDLEMDVRKACTTMERNGIRVDLPFCDKMIEELTYEIEMIKVSCLDDFGFSVSSNAELGKALIEHGAPLRDLTPSGKPSVTREALEEAKAEATGDAARIVDMALDFRSKQKLVSSYFTNFRDLSDSEGLLHPSIETVAARTGRMCLPDTHMLLTQRGPLKIDDVVVGDMTLDEAGNWVAVEAIHRYADQPTVVWESSRLRLESTAEHRWVTYSEKGVRRLEPITGTRRTVRLAPQTLFDPYQLDPVYEKGNLAALIGWLVTDGRCVEEGKQLRAFLYQTERKFLSAMRLAVPDEAVMYDRITNGDHHEIRIKTRWLRPVLRSLGLSANPRHDPRLPLWVSTLSLRDCHAFLQAVWLADGSTAHPHNKQICCDSESLRQAIQVAAYRCGFASHISNDGFGGWSTKDRLGVKMKQPVASVRNMMRSESRADVWCVTTSTGTFTAWDRGPYLTGNSVRNPALQTLPRGDSAEAKTVRRAVLPRHEGEVLVSADYSQIELRLIACHSGDPALQEAFHIADDPASDADFFTAATRIVYDDHSIVKSDPRRTGVKTLFYAACPHPDTRVLCEDLVWRRAGDLVVGQRLLSFDEFYGEHAHPRARARRWRHAEVTHTDIQERPSVRITLASGQELVCATDHHFLSQTSHTKTTTWKAAGHLRPGLDYLPRYVEPWTPDLSYEAGWLAGIFDGEGCINKDMRWRISQLPGLVADRIDKTLASLGVPYGTAIHPTSGVISWYSTASRIYDDIRLLGQVQSSRLIPKINLDNRLMWRLPLARGGCDMVLDVKEIGMQPTVTLQTSTATYITEGYGSHNSYGAGTAKMAATAGMSFSDMDAIADKVFKRYPGVKSLMKKCERRILENSGWITTPDGRSIYVDPERGYKAMNALIQGSAADIFKRAVVELAHAGLEEQMVCVVHDEVLFSLPPEDVPEAKAIIRDVMTRNDYPVPLTAEPSDGAHTWADVDK